jgi:hypothetical protein
MEKHRSAENRSTPGFVAQRSPAVNAATRDHEHTDQGFYVGAIKIS